MRHPLDQGGAEWGSLEVHHDALGLAAAVHEAVAGIQQALLWGLDIDDCRSLAVDAFLELTGSTWGALAHIDLVAAPDDLRMAVVVDRRLRAEANPDGPGGADDELATLARPHVVRAAANRSVVVASVPASLDRLLVLPVPGAHAYVVLARADVDYSEDSAAGLEPLRRLTGQVDTWAREIQIRRATERELERERRRLSLALSASDVGVFEFDASTGMLDWDARVWDMHGLAPRAGPWTPADWTQVLHPDDAERAVEDLLTSVATQRPLQAEYRVVRESDEVRHIRATAQVFEHEAGRRRLVGVYIDVTADIRLQQELAAGRAQAEAATRAKSQFLAVMSHEIRTPMNGVLGMLDLMLRSGLPPEQHERAATAHASAECLLHLLNDILDLSKLESQQLAIETIPFQPARVVADTVSLLAPRAAEKPLALEAHIDPDVPAWVSGDPMRVRQVLLNLTGNAIKFTAEGHVTVAARMTRCAESGQPLLRVDVRDTGEGITPEAQARLFQQFVQADSSTARRFGGTGLGLAISRQLVELMGGRIGLSSELGAGSTFWFEVPAASSTPAPGHTADEGDAPRRPETLPALHVLAVDDNAVNRRLVSAFLAPAGHQVCVVECGAAALAALETTRFDLVLLDIQMPVMDGPECLQRIRALEGPARDVPVVALTANAMAGDRERYLAAGFDGYVSKPFTTATLSEAMARALSRRHARV